MKNLIIISAVGLIAWIFFKDTFKTQALGQGKTEVEKRWSDLRNSKEFKEVINTPEFEQLVISREFLLFAKAMGKQQIMSYLGYEI